MTIFKLDPVTLNISQHADDRMQHFNATKRKLTLLGATRVRLATLLQGRSFAVARSHLTSRIRQKFLLAFVLMLHDVCSVHDLVLVFTDECIQPVAKGSINTLNQSKWNLPCAYLLFILESKTLKENYSLVHSRSMCSSLTHNMIS